MPTLYGSSPFAQQQSRASREWEMMDMRGETQYVQDYHDARQLTAAFENMNPDQGAKKQNNADEFVRVTLASKPPATYRGPRLAWPLVPEEVEALVVHFATSPSVHLDVTYACQIFHEARAMFLKLPPVNRVTTNSGRHKKLVVVGDTHGQLADLVTIFIENGFPSPTGTQYVFNGDFVDRGEYGVEVALILLAYKLLYPNTVHLNRGNHETLHMNINYGFIDELDRKFGGPQLMTLISQTWNALPIATVIDSAVLVLHGGLFRTNGITLTHLNSLPKKDNDLASTAPDMMLLTDVLWSDPQEAPGRVPGVRGSGTIQFGPDITKQFLAQNKLRLLIRSHQVPSTNRGYEVLQHGLCITVFSASNYCGSQGNHGGLVVFEAPGRHNCIEFWAPPLSVIGQELARRSVRRKSDGASMPRVEDPNVLRLQMEEANQKARRQVLSQLQELITKRHSDLTWYYKGCQQDSKGCISMADWRAGLSSVLQLNVDWATHERDLLKGDVRPQVDWRKFLSYYQVLVAEKFSGWMDELKSTILKRLTAADLSVSDYFRMFDADGDGNIEAHELQAGLSKGLGVQLSAQQAQEMVTTMVGPDGRLDVMTFLESLRMEYQGKAQPADVQEVIGAIEKTLATGSKSMLEVFKQLDRNGDGKLSLAEFQQFLDWLARAYPQYGHLAKPGLAQKVLRAFDEDLSGTVTLLEFLSNFKPSTKGYSSHVDSLVQEVARALFDHKSSLKALFYRIDTDGNGCVSPTEFREGLRTLATLDCKLSNEELSLVASHVDVDGNGEISWQEFLSAFGLDPAARQKMGSTGGGSR